MPHKISEPALQAAFSVISVGSVARSVCEVTDTDARGRGVDEAYILERSVIDVLVMFKTLYGGVVVVSNEEH